MSAAPRSDVDVSPAVLELGAGPSLQISYKKQSCGPEAYDCGLSGAYRGNGGATLGVCMWRGRTPGESQMAGATDAAAGWPGGLLAGPALS